MNVHLKKLCVGCRSIAELERSHKARMAWGAENNMPEGRVWHDTRHFPRRAGQLKLSGSLYWIIKGYFSVRQTITDFQEVPDPEGRPLCRIFLNPTLIKVDPYPCRPFQGWRYLLAEDAPQDMGKEDAEQLKNEGSMEVARELASLGLL